MGDHGGAQARREYLTFCLGGEEYAVSILAVKAVVGFSRITPVPLMPACVLGVISLRGAVVPVVDLAVKFGGGGAIASKKTCIIIVEPEADEEIEGERTQVGLIAEAVGRVIEFDEECFAEAPPFGTRVQAGYLSGLGRTPEGFVMILDINRALSTLEVLNEARGGVAGRLGDDALAARLDPSQEQGAVSI